MKEKLFNIKGTVKEILPDFKFKVKLINNYFITAYISGKMRQNHIRILKGDKVNVEISNYDLKKGRIKFRYS